jgi:hypothetical protein
MSEASITCGKCGGSADWEAFTSTPVMGELPLGQYQCPLCRYAWRMIPEGTGKRYASGFYIPPKLRAQAVEARL